MKKLLTTIYNQPYILLSLTMLFWSGNIVLGRGIAGEIPPIALAQMRWIGATILISFFTLKYVRNDWPTIKKHIPILLLLSLVGITAYNTMTYIGLQYTTAINGLLMQSAAPVIIGFWSFILFRDALTKYQAVGIIISLVGVIAIITKGDVSALAELRFNKGDLWIFAAFTCYSLYTCLLRKRASIHWLSLLWVTFCWGAIMLMPFTVAEYVAGARVNLNAKLIGSLAYIVIFAGTLAYICFNRGIELIGANRAGPFFHLMPVFGSILAIAFLGERPAFYHLIGYAFILLGVVISQRQKL